MAHHEVARLNADDTPSAVRWGGRMTENDAAHLALSVANTHEIDTCVVEVYSRGSERIVQRIKHRNDVVLAEPVDPVRYDQKFYAGPVTVPVALEFIAKYAAGGYTLTVTPAFSALSGEQHVNVVAVPTLPMESL